MDYRPLGYAQVQSLPTLEVAGFPLMEPDSPPSVGAALEAALSLHGGCDSVPIPDPVAYLVEPGMQRGGDQLVDSGQPLGALLGLAG